MGANTVAYLDHKLDINQLKELDQLLNRTIKSPVGIVRFLNQLGQQYEGYNRNSWTFEVLPDDEHLAEAYTCLDGPEGLSMYVGLNLVTVSAGGRWRSFINVKAWREIQLEIVKRIGEVIGASTAIWIPDYSHDIVSDKLGEMTIQDVEDLFNETCGQAQPSIDKIDEHIDERLAADTVWYIQRY